MWFAIILNMIFCFSDLMRPSSILIDIQLMFNWLSHPSSLMSLHPHQDVSHVFHFSTLVCKKTPFLLWYVGLALGHCLDLDCAFARRHWRVRHTVQLQQNQKPVLQMQYLHRSNVLQYAMLLAIVDTVQGKPLQCRLGKPLSLLYLSLGKPLPLLYLSSSWQALASFIYEPQPTLTVKGKP